MQVGEEVVRALLCSYAKAYVTGQRRAYSLPLVMACLLFSSLLEFIDSFTRLPGLMLVAALNLSKVRFQVHERTTCPKNIRPISPYHETVPQ